MWQMFVLRDITEMEMGAGNVQERGINVFTMKVGGA